MKKKNRASGSGDPFTTYLADLSNLGLFNREEEMEAFLDYYSKEEEHVRHLLTTNPELARDVLLGAAATFRRRGGQDEATWRSLARFMERIAGTVESDPDRAASQFIRKMRKHDPVRQVQHEIYDEAVRRDLESFGGGGVDPGWMARTSELRDAVLEVRNYIARANLRLVINFSKKYLGSAGKLTMADLVQEGNVGLLLAVEKFDVSVGVRFSTYASWWVRQSIRRAISDQGRTVRIPVHLGDKAAKLVRAKAQHYLRTGEHMDRKELAEAVGVAESKLDALVASRLASTSLDAPAGEDGSLMDVVEDEEAELPDAPIARQALARDLRRAMSRLSSMERYVIMRRFDFGTPDTEILVKYGMSRAQAESFKVLLSSKRKEGGSTLRDIAEDFGLSRERIRQIQDKALAKLARDEALSTHR